MGCLGRLLNLILLYTVFGVVGLAARMSALLLGFLLAVIFRIFVFLLGWMVISLMALRSPRRSADTIVDRINDQLLQSGLWRLSGPGLNQVIRVLAYLGFVIGWSLTIFIAYEIAIWLL
jgi:hypothetical protein